METRDFVTLGGIIIAASLAFFFNGARARADRLFEAYATWVGAVQRFLAACEDEWADWYEASLTRHGDGRFTQHHSGGKTGAW